MEKERQKKNEIKIILLSNFLNNLYLLPIVLTLYLNNINVGLKEIAIIFTAMKITSLMVEIPSGISSDKFGHKSTVLLGFLFKGLGFLFLFISNNLYFLVLGSIFLGASKAFLSGSYEALFVEKIKDLEMEKLKIYNSYRRTLSLFGNSGGILLSTFLVGYSYYNLIFFITFTVLLINSLLIILFTKDTRYKKNKNKSLIKSTFKDFFTKRNINYFSFSFLSMTIVDIPIEIYVLLILKNLGYTPFESGLILSLKLMVNIITGYFSSKIKNKKYIHLIVRYNYILIVLLFTLIGVINIEKYTFFILFFISPILFGLVQPHRFQIQHENIDSHNRASILSLQSLFMVGISALTLTTYSFITESHDFRMAISILGTISLSLLILNNSIKAPK